MAIVIGRDYKAAFDGMCRLIAGGCAPDGVKLENGRIVCDGGVFEYSDAVAGIDVTDGMSVKMNAKDGASWFASLRGGARAESDLALWKKLVKSVGDHYRRNYSLVDYGTVAEEPTEEARSRMTDLVLRLAQMFYPSDEAEIRERRGGMADVYGLNVRAEMGSGAGDPVPVLGRLYFRRTDKGLVPLAGGDAREAEAFTASARGAKDAKKSASLGGESNGRTILDVFGALNVLVGGRTAFSLGECLYFPGERDRKELRELVVKLPAGANTIECTRLEVLGIFRMRLPDSIFDVCEDGVPVLRAVISATGKVSLYCVACNAPLMENGRIYCSDEEGDTVIELDKDEDDLGLGDGDVEYILAHSAFGEHLMPNSCVGVSCRRRICAARQENLGTEEEPRLACSDCPYPEVVFVTPDGRRLYTPDLAFARDAMTLVPRSQTAKCTVCGRTFTAESLRRVGLIKTCAFCTRAFAEADADSASARKLYKRFSGMLGYGVRLRHIGKKKYCFDDDDITMMMLGDDVYILDKSEMRSRGRIAKPRKTN